MRRRRRNEEEEEAKKPAPQLLRGEIVRHQAFVTGPPPLQRVLVMLSLPALLEDRIEGPSLSSLPTRKISNFFSEGESPRNIFFP